MMSATLHNYNWTKDQSHRNRIMPPPASSGPNPGRKIPDSIFVTRLTPLQRQARVAFWWGVICFFLGLVVGLLSGGHA